MQFFQFLYGWIMNAAFYLVIFTAVLHVLPGEQYQKYVRFFTGLVIVVLLFSPLFKLLGMEHLFQGFRQNAEYRQLQKEMKQASGFLEEKQGELEEKQAEQEESVKEKATQEDDQETTNQAESGQKEVNETETDQEGGRIHVEEIRVEGEKPENAADQE